MYLDSFFRNNKTVNVTFESRTITIDSRGRPTYTAWTTSTTKDVLFWKGSAAVKLASDQFKQDVSGVLVSKNVDSINNDMRVSYGGEYYSIVYIDNVAYQDKVYQVFLKGYKEQ